MSILFIDSTYDLTVGLLDENLKWLKFETHQGQKASTIIQVRVDQLLAENSLQIKDIKTIITANGPGFYTGLRLAEGFADVFKFFGIPHYSFYSYEVPKWCGVSSGVWFTKAYRGEYFLYKWNERVTEKLLLPANDIQKVFSSTDKVYIHSEISLDVFSSSLISMPQMTISLLKENSNIIFKEILNKKIQREPYYFRAPEDEFKVNP